MANRTRPPLVPTLPPVGRLAEPWGEEEATHEGSLLQVSPHISRTRTYAFVVDENGRLYGSIAFEDLADAAFDPARERSATARDLVHRTPVALVPEDNLETALRLCEMNHEEHCR